MILRIFIKQPSQSKRIEEDSPESIRKCLRCTTPQEASDAQWPSSYGAPQTFSLIEFPKQVLNCDFLYTLEAVVWIFIS